ncbi:MAG: branched-chain amino acid transport system permease protein [Solirubrobacteraceae bacterium]|jgi:branched-chain amino acid transport system permease protein|nr:branched-chain amino acid transport system permease protein [Solirubrobacteraceae bacterium]
MVRRAALGVFILALLLVPYQLDQFWISTGLFAMAAAIAAIGLTLLVGTTGQLSLGHAFFIMVGAYGYSYFAGDPPIKGFSSEQANGLQLNPILSLVLAVLAAGIAGAIFSPIAGRLKGIYLGLASLGLVFVGQHILQNISALTGGFNGRDAKEFAIGGFHFANTNPDNFDVFGVRYGQFERLWYLGLVLVLLSWWLARNIIHSRPGRALQAVRDSEIAAGVMGIDVRVYKAAAFTISSMFAGLGGALYALAYEHIVPESFSFLFSIDFLVMIVIGGLGSVGGAIAGAVFVSALPLVLDHWSGSLPLVAAEGGSGLQAGQAARLIYGAAVVVIMIYAPRGLAGLGQRFKTNKPRPQEPPAAPVPTTKESTA